MRWNCVGGENMADMEKVIKGLRDIDGFIAGRIGFEQARNFLRTIDETIELLKEQQEIIDRYQWEDGEPK